MNLLHSAIALILNILFPLRRFYEPVSNEDAGTDMPADRTRLMDTSNHPYLQSPRLKTSARGDGRGFFERANNWRQSLNLGNFFGGRDGIEQRGEETSERRRNLPTVQQTPHRVLHADNVDQSKRLFQDKLDECSESDVIRQCQFLNEKINNTVLSLVDDWSENSSASRRLKGLGVLSDSKREKYLQKVIGATLCTSIKSKTSSPPSGELQDLVTDALQSSAVDYISWIVSSTFSPGISSSTNGEMHGIFLSMLSQEPLATALRWRALTYKHSTKEPKTLAIEYRKVLSSDFRHIFRLAGEGSSSKFLTRIPDAVRDSEIIESTLELSEILKTKLFSVHLDVYAIRPGEPFREDDMEFDSGNKDAIGNHPVLCTLEIGLRELSPQTGSGRILLKPKVVLEKPAVRDKKLAKQLDRAV